MPQVELVKAFKDGNVVVALGELQEGGMVEVGLSDDIVPKLTVEFKAKKTLTQLKPKTVTDEKTS